MWFLVGLAKYADLYARSIVVYSQNMNYKFVHNEFNEIRIILLLQIAEAYNQIGLQYICKQKFNAHFIFRPQCDRNR